MTSQNWTYPTITFSHSLEMEARRLIYQAALLPSGTLQNLGFIILRERVPQIPLTSQVIIPDLPYNSIPNFWDSLKSLKLVTPIKAPKHLVSNIQNLISPIYNEHVYTKHLDKLVVDWQKIDKVFWNNLFTLFPKYVQQIRSIQVYSTAYGPYTTFSLAESPARYISVRTARSFIYSGLFSLVSSAPIWRPNFVTLGKK